MSRSLLAGTLFVLATVSSSVSAAPYSDVYFFGDSLTDTGNDFILSSTLHAIDPSVPIVPAPGGYNDSGRFSNGPVYSEQLAQRLGFDLRPSLLGGTNYAYGGARTDSVTLPLSLSFEQQVQQFTEASGPADPDALYVLFIGGNDATDVLQGLAPPDTLSAAVARIGASIEAIAAEGARHLLIPNVADLGLAPLATVNGAIERNLGASAIASTFNELLAAMLRQFDGSPLDIVEFDTFALLNDWVADPARFGLTDVRHSCQQPTGATLPDGQPEYAIFCSDADAAGHLFWDEMHPTTSAHGLLADALLAALQVPEPATLALVLAGLAAASAARRRDLLGAPAEG